MALTYALLGLVIGGGIGLYLASRMFEKVKDSKETSAKHMENAFTSAADTAFDRAVSRAEKEKMGEFESATKGLREDLSSYKKKVDAFEKAAIARESALQTEVSAVSKLGMQLTQDTRDLTKALKGDSQKQGAWGELVLENLLQDLGFVEDRDYIKQFSETFDDGKRKRADFIVFLPDDRQVVIDSKVSLTAWDDFVKAENDEDAEKAMKAHCTSIRVHIKKLAAKNYEEMEGINSLDFVLMFVPIEGAFYAAIKADSNLYQEISKNRRVEVVSGLDIGRTLMFIKDNWIRVNQSRNQIRLAEEAGKLHDKIVGFLVDFDDIGRRIRQTGESYNLAYNKLVSGTGNIVKRTKDLREYGAKAKKDVPEELLREAAEEHSRGFDTSGLVVIEVEEEE